MKRLPGVRCWRLNKVRRMSTHRGRHNVEFHSSSIVRRAFTQESSSAYEVKIRTRRTFMQGGNLE